MGGVAIGLSLAASSATAWASTPAGHDNHLADSVGTPSHKAATVAPGHTLPDRTVSHGSGHMTRHYDSDSHRGNNHSTHSDNRHSDNRHSDNQRSDGHRYGSSEGHSDHDNYRGGRDNHHRHHHHRHHHRGGGHGLF
jgi:hypothetical protein